MVALRLFYEADGLKYSEERDFPKFLVEDNESWVELHFTLNKSEQAQVKNDYLLPDGTLKVRRLFKSDDKQKVKAGQSNIFAYEGGILSNNLFYGAKNVSQAKLGSVVYIPAVGKTDEAFKLTGPSPFRNLLNMVMKEAVVSSQSYEDLSKAIGDFDSSFRKETTRDGVSVNGLVDELNSELDTWGVSLGVDINPMKPEEIVKALLSYHLQDVQLGGEKLQADAHGQGLQRHLIFTVIKLAAKYKNGKKGKSKEFNPELNLLLFEEPEVFLSPPQQDTLGYSLRDLTKSETQQVCITSHSSHFVSKQLFDIPCLIKVRRDDGCSSTWQICQESLERLCDENMGLYRAMCEFEGKELNEEGKLEDESFLYHVWLDAERTSLFFAHHVIICEGATEKAFLDHLKDTQWTDLRDGKVYFLDSLGKYNIHRFMKLCGELGIRHSVIMDSDYDRNKQAVINKFIDEHQNEWTTSVFKFDGDFEEYLDIPVPTRVGSHQKPLNALKRLIRGEIEGKKLSRLKEIVLHNISPD